jgi:hypothetical protein
VARRCRPDAFGAPAFALRTQPLDAASPHRCHPPPTQRHSTKVHSLVRCTGRRIPASFFGLSFEWGGSEEWPDAFSALAGSAGFSRLLNNLNNDNGALVLRMGGNSQDEMTGVPPGETFEALRRLHREAGALFIIGVNMKVGGWRLRQADGRHADW